MPQESISSTTRQRDARLLGALFAAGGTGVSRHELQRVGGLNSDSLDAALLPYLQAGYPIESHPQGEIVLRAPPDIWCAEEILGRCASREGAPGWDPLLLSETTSTNDVARQQGRAGAHAGFLVAASHQTRGRGRLGRSWESPRAGGLYVSLLLRPDLAVTEAGRLTILSSVAAADAVEAVIGLRPRIKWPNDLEIGGRKLAGLLIETEPKGARIGFAVIGFGINVNQQAEDFSVEVRGRATSLRLATGQAHRRADVLVALLQAMETRLAQPFELVRSAWAASSLTLGQQVSLTTARGRRQGQAVGLDESGALLLRNPAGEIETITAGDMAAA